MRIDVIGVPLDLGAGLRGVDVGPSAIRHAGLIERLRKLDHLVDDLGNLPTPIRSVVTEGSPSVSHFVRRYTRVWGAAPHH